MQEDSLFGPPVEVDAPRTCTLCGDPVKWMQRAQRWGNYCGGQNCINATRICKYCKERYRRDEGGTRYCSTECRTRWHYENVQPVKRSIRKVNGGCSYCGKNRYGHNLWDLCAEHYEQIAPVANQLRMHHVSTWMVHRLFADPTCFNPGCATDIMKRNRNELSGRYRTELAVDHDHSHCPVSYSCGLCVRGLLCSRCNTAAGQLLDDPIRAEGLARYLQTGAISSEP